MKKLLLVLVCTLSSLNAMELVVKKDQGLFVPEELGLLEVIKTRNGFQIQKDGEATEVNSFDVDPSLRKMTTPQLDALLKLQAGYIAVSKVGEKDYKLQAKIRGEGGGPVSGFVAYWAVKGGAYLGICATTLIATSAAASTLPITGPVVGGGGALVSGVMGIASGTSAATGLAITTAAGTGTTAGIALASSIQSTSAIVAASAAIETASASVGVFFAAIPFLP